MSFFSDPNPRKQRIEELTGQTSEMRQPNCHQRSKYLVRGPPINDVKQFKTIFLSQKLLKLKWQALESYVVDGPLLPRWKFLLDSLLI